MVMGAGSSGWGVWKVLGVLLDVVEVVIVLAFAAALAVQHVFHLGGVVVVALLPDPLWSCLMQYIPSLSDNSTFFSFCICLFFFIVCWTYLSPSINCLMSFCDTLNTTASYFFISVNCWNCSSVWTTKAYIGKPLFCSTCKMSQLYTWRHLGCPYVMYSLAVLWCWDYNIVGEIHNLP